MAAIVFEKGDKLGLLTIRCKSSKKTSNGSLMWNCICDCGNKFRAAGTELRKGSTRSCGCLRGRHPNSLKNRHKTHGLSYSKTYKVWTVMKQRCSNPKHKRYADWGGRGIRVCKRWLVFENFLADMGEAPKGKQLDRRENDGDYRKSNCRWVTRKVQMNNKRNTPEHKRL